MIKQHKLAQLGADAIEIGLLQVGDDAFERQVERLDVVYEIGFDRGDEAGPGIAGPVPGCAPRLDQSVAADRAEAQNDRDDRRDHPQRLRWRAGYDPA
jgi:hypothetical protein